MTTLEEHAAQAVEAKAQLQQWVDAQGHDRCWYYPEIFQKLVDIFGIQATLPANLPPRAEFEQGCRRYQATEYEKK